MTVFEELVDELKVDNLIDEKLPERMPQISGEHDLSQLTNGDKDDDLVLRKHRAEDEFSTVQFIAHIFDGIESGSPASGAAAMCAAKARKALTAVLQFSGPADDLNFFRIRNEFTKTLDAWQHELKLRDGRIGVSQLRMFCESSHPPLSAKSLIALAGLYRSAEFSDLVRDKFDFVITRLFSCEANSVKREMRFDRSETIERIQDLYRKWGIRPPERSESDNGLANDAVAKFASFGARIDASPTFTDLFRSDLPANIREFKKTLGSNIFEPEVLARVMDCNVKIGNRFVEIAAIEKQAYGPDAVRSKYGDAYDQVATETAVRTLRLSELLDSEDLKPEKIAIKPVVKQVEPTVAKAKKKKQSPGSNFWGVNKWLLAVTVITVLAGAAVFFFAEVEGQKMQTGMATAKPTDLANSELGRYFSNGRTTESTFYLNVEPDWEGLTPEEKKRLLKSALERAKKLGMRSVQILGKEGQRVAFASDSREELTER